MGKTNKTVNTTTHKENAWLTRSANYVTCFSGNISGAGNKTDVFYNTTHKLFA